MKSNRQQTVVVGPTCVRTCGDEREIHLGIHFFGTARYSVQKGNFSESGRREMERFTKAVSASGEGISENLLERRCPSYLDAMPRDFAGIYRPC